MTSVVLNHVSDDYFYKCIRQSNLTLSEMRILGIVMMKNKVKIKDLESISELNSDELDSAINSLVEKKLIKVPGRLVEVTK